MDRTQKSTLTGLALAAAAGIGNEVGPVWGRRRDTKPKPPLSKYQKERRNTAKKSRKRNQRRR